MIAKKTVNIAIIGIGSNIEPEANISKMLHILGDAVDIVKLSSFVKTRPIGMDNQPDFTNGVVNIKTSMKQEELRVFLKDVEDRRGRDRTSPPYGPRTIDLDVVVWNGEIVDEDYYERDFLRKNVRKVS